MTRFFRPTRRGPVDGSEKPLGRSLFRKYAVVLVLLVSTSLLASGVIQLYFSYRETQASLLVVQAEKAAGAASRIESFLGEIEREVAGSTPTPGLPGPDASALRQEALRRLLRQQPAITDLRYLDAGGHEQVFASRLALNRADSGLDLSQDPRFLDARDGRIAYSPVYFRDESEPYLTLSVGEPGPPGGVTVAEVNLKFIWDVVSRIRVGQSGYAYVVDQRGQLVAHPDLGLVLRRADFSALRQVQTALSATAESDPSIGTTLGGESVLSAHEFIDPPGWSVFVEQPVGEAFAPLYASILRSVLLLVAGLGLAVLVSLALARRMVSPIRVLEAGAARVGSGALYERIEVRTGDELERLADAFNGMSTQLEASYAGLEQKVEARTRELAEAMRELEAANRHKSAFLAAMSHELRTPLNAIIGFSDLLLERLVGDLNQRQERYVSHITASGRHLLSLINDILDVSKVEAGRMQLEPSRFSLAEVLEHGMLIVGERASRHAIQFDLEVDPAIGTILADERKIKQVVFNLVSNAVKFTPDGGRITVTARVVGDEVQVLVRDTGVGIAENERERIFESFVQVGQSPDRAHEGTGLGLALARAFVELHGGRIWVESQPGVGSEFGFSLPALLSEQTNIGVEQRVAHSVQ